MAANSTKMQEGFSLLLPPFAETIGYEFYHKYGDSWWKEIEAILSDQLNDLPVDNGDYGMLVDSLDIANCIRIFTRNDGWNDVFRGKYDQDCRNWATELMGWRNNLAHMGAADFSDEDTERALDTMARLCDSFNGDVADQIRALREEIIRARYAALLETKAEETKEEAKEETFVKLNDLPSWRDVIEPHPDVAQGRYKTAEFAADLWQVSKGEGMPEYLDPREFFNRTYVTEGLKGLLVQAIRRVTDKGGAPVIQLKTAFGGGKTHSMLALYHMMKGEVSFASLPNLEAVRSAAETTSLPKIHVAVIVGTAINPAKSTRPKNLPGVTVNTIWGEIAAQLAVSCGKPELYEFIREADKKGVSPGSDALRQMMDAASPCMILMDELVAYARKLYGKENLPAGTYDNFITFVQEITEAARLSGNGLVVASIPESESETAGEAGAEALRVIQAHTDNPEEYDEIGKTALRTIEHTFGRMESVWKPVEASEGFEVVRRRLFLDCDKPALVEAICEAYSKMYRDNKEDFPVDTRELSYRERMVRCYPIHPEIFDRLYNDWATLPGFQRTRGVLRLMAAVIHELWMTNDPNPLILPASFPMDKHNVWDELQKNLPESMTWSSVVDHEVDGKSSIPYAKDKEDKRFARQQAARRVARTILLGSAPTNRNQTVRGLETTHIRLGSVHVGDSIPVVNDALSKLQVSLTYLYSDPSGSRFWYDTRPTLRKTVEDRKQQIARADIDYEIETRLKKIKREQPFDRMHVCPNSSSEVLDEQTVGLVFLKSDDAVRQGVKTVSSAQNRAEEILATRGTSPRIYRNMLAFLAPDASQVEKLRDETARYLAWKSVSDEKESLNLDAAQQRETDQSLSRADTVVGDKLKDTWCWLLVPYVDLTDIKTMQWQIEKLGGGQDSVVSRVIKKLAASEMLIQKWAPQLLRMVLDQILWRENNCISIRTLWDQLCTYCYLPRLSGWKVLEESIREGLPSGEYFGYAAGIDHDRFIDLKYKALPGWIDKSGYLVKIDAAKKQIADEEAAARIEEEKRKAAQQNGQSGGSSASGVDSTTPARTSEKTGESGAGTEGKIDNRSSSGSEAQPKKQPTTHFSLSTQLSYTRINKSVQQIVEEIISHIYATEGVELTINLEVTAEAEKGFSQDTIRAVVENGNTLKIDHVEFNQ